MNIKNSNNHNQISLPNDAQFPQRAKQNNNNNNNKKKPTSETKFSSKVKF